VSDEDNVTELPVNGGSPDPDDEAAFEDETGDEAEGRSLEDLADDEDETPEAELFPMGSLDGDEVTPQKVVKRGLPTTITVSLSKAEVPVKGGGMLNHDSQGRVLVTHLPAKIEEIPQRDDDNSTRITGWKIRQNLRAVHVRRADDPAEMVRLFMDELIVADPAAAQALIGEYAQQQLGSASAAA
jgi:hypothetical protein